MARRRRPLTWVREHPTAFDWGIATLVTVTVLVTISADRGARTATGHLARNPNALSALLAVGACFVPLTFRRRRPVLALGVSVGATLVYQWSHFADGAIALGALIAAYSVGAYSANRRRVLHTAVLLLGLLAVGNVVSIVSEHRARGPLGNLAGNTIVFGTAFVVGDNVRRRRERLAHLEERALANERERDMLARQAVGDEQRRIARELHDVIAHSLSVMVVQAGAARRIIAKKPEQAEQAIAAIETTGREALAEMRQLLGVLRGEGPARAVEIAPQPSLDRVAELVHADPDLDVGLSIEGDAIALPATVDVQAYRIVQEALTNVRKHAGPAEAHVTVRYRADGVELTVSDNGRGAAASAPIDANARGHGLVGMRERVALCDGTLHAGPQRGGGWIVDAFLPIAMNGASAEREPRTEGAA